MADNVIEFLIKGNASGAKKAFGSLDDVLAKATKGLTILGAAYAAVEVVKFIGHQIEVADQMGKMALKSGVAVEAFSQMAHAFSLSDVSAEELAGGFKFLNKAIDEAKQGNDAAQRSFESIGVSMANLKNDSPDEVMLKLADAFTQIEDSAARSTLLEKFGRAGIKLAPAMEEGRAGIEKLMKQADALGLTVDKEFAAAADRFGDSMQTVSAAAQGAGRQLGKMLLPILQETIDALFKFGDTGAESMLPWGKIVVTTVGVAAAALLVLKSAVVTTVTAVGAVFKATGQAITAVLSSIGEAEDDAADPLEAMRENWAEVGKTAVSAVNSIGGEIKTTADAINKMDAHLQNYGKSVTKVGEETKKAGGSKIDPVSKEAATRLETLRVAVLGFISTMDKATAAASGNKLAAIDAEYNAQLDAINNLKASEAQKNEMLLALNTNYAAQRVALNDSMLAQTGIGNDAYRARQAELIAQDAERMALAGVSEADVLNFKNVSLLQLQADYLAKKNSAITADYSTQDEIAAARYEEEKALIMLQREEKFIGEEEFKQRNLEAQINYEASLGNIIAQGQRARLQFAKMTFDEQLKSASTGLSGITTLMGSENKKQFAIGKAAAIAQATINAYTSATQAYKALSGIYIVGPILGAIAAAAAIAAGMANVSKIRSQQMGQAHAGMTSIPAEGSYLLDKGERVIQPEQNKDLTNFLGKGEEGDGSGTQIGSVSVNITVPDGEALRNMSRREWEDMVSDKVIPALNVLDRKGVRPDSVQRYDR